jgi:hypothetical protein
MSNYERERGTIVLPTAEVAPLKQVLREYTNKLREEVRVEAIRLHKEINTRSLSLYKERWHALHYQSQGRSSTWSKTSRRDLVNNVASSVISRMLYRVEKESIAPQQPTLADLNALVPQATNKTTRFSVFDEDGYGEAEITFEGRKVNWDVPENNRAVEHAHNGEIAQLFFRHLDRIQWTRGTGGVGVYHSEYDQNDSPYGYANSVTFAYGPEGEKVEAHRMGMSVAKYRSTIVPARRQAKTLGRW